MSYNQPVVITVPVLLYILPEASENITVRIQFFLRLTADSCNITNQQLGM